MLGLTSLGIVHTAISLVAVIAGARQLIREGAISPERTAGKVYVWFTIATCLTGFGIFQHGGFGKPHALGVITLVTLAVVGLARRGWLFGRLARYVATVGYSLTFFFHMVPALTETFTRLPAGHPLFDSPEDPTLQALNGLCFLLFLAGATVQVLRLRARGRRAAPGRMPA